MEKINIIKVNNPFNRCDKDIEVIDYNGESLAEIKNKYFRDMPVIVSVNGKVVPDTLLEKIKANPNDYILFLPHIEGGDEILRVAAMLALVTISIYVPYAMGLYTTATVAGGTAELAFATQVFSGFTLAGSLMSAGIMMVGGLLVNTLLPPPLPDIDSDFGFEGSKIYSWNPHTTQEQGIVVPKFYGLSKVRGNIIAVCTENIDNKNYLNVLISLGLGPISRLYDFRINNQAANPDYVQIHARYGNLTQDVIPNFNKTKTDYPVNVKLDYNTPYIYETTGDAFDGLEVEITFPQGLFYANDYGGLSGISVQIKVEIQKKGETDWIVLSQEAKYDYVTITASSNTPIIKTFKTKENLAHGKYYVKVTKLSQDYSSHRYMDKVYFSTVREVVNDQFTYPRNVLVGLCALASDKLSGSLDFSCLIEGALIRSTTDGINWTIGYNNNPAWVCFDIITQPVFSDPDESGQRTVLRYDGISPDRIDINSFLAWANWCDELVPDGKGGTEKRFTFNGGFDSGTTLWDAVLQVCNMARALPVWIGAKLTIVVDKKVDLSTDVTQMFTMGNIYTDSFTETFLSSSERCGELEITFLNKDKDYEKGVFSVFNTNLNKPTNKTTIQLIGTTSASQAWRIGTFKLAQNELLHRTIQFDADVDSIACTIGDVIYFAHDVPQWGLVSGRVVSSTANTVVVDKNVTIESGKSYKVKVWHNDDTIETKSIINSPGTTTTLVISGTWNINPEQYSVFTFGEAGVEAKPFRVTSVSRTGDLKCTLECIEYDENCYAVDTETPKLPTINYSTLTPISPVTNLFLAETARYNESGILIREIVVSFVKPNNPLYEKAIIFYRKTGGLGGLSPWLFAGECYGTEFSITNVEPNTSYEVLVVSRSFSGVKTTITESPTKTITTGRYSIVAEYSYDRVTGLQIFGQGNDNVFKGRDCKFVWNPVTSAVVTDVGAGEEATGAGWHIPIAWFLDYEVKILNSDLTLRRTEYTPLAEYTYTYEKNYEDGNGTPVRNFIIQVRARDRSFRLSDTVASLTVTNEAPPKLENITVTAGTSYYIVEFAPSTVPDLAGYRIYASQTQGFTPGSSNIVNDGTDTRVVVAPHRAGTWYVRVAAYDTFGEIDLNYSDEFQVYVDKWLEYNEIELEFMKMSFNSVSWAQFAIFDDFTTEAKRDATDPFTYKAKCYKNSIVASGSLPNTVYGWTTKTYNNVTTIETGTSTSVGQGYLTDTSKNWFTNEVKGLYLVDANLNVFLIDSNTSNTIYLENNSVTPAAGSYSLKDDNPSYMVCFCSYEDSTEAGGSGYVKLEVSFDGGSHWQTVLDTENNIDRLDGTVEISHPGVNYKARISLKTDANGNSPVVKKFLICTDPSPWRF